MINTLNTTNNRYHIAQLKVFATTLNAATAISDDTYTKPVDISSHCILFYVGMMRTILLFAIKKSSLSFDSILCFDDIFNYVQKPGDTVHREVSRAKYNPLVKISQ